MLSKALEMMRKKQGTGQFIRFCINGVIAAAIHYGVYFLLQLWIDVNIAYTAVWLGVHHLIAPPLVMLVAMSVQFTILRFVFVKKEKPNKE